MQAIGSTLAPGNGGEAVAEESTAHDAFQEKVRQPPDMLAAEATEHRFNLTAGISNAALTLALDASESIGAAAIWSATLPTRWRRRTRSA